MMRERKAFSMITAIVVIVLLATVSVLVMSLSGKMVKETTQQYQREQAILLGKSYLEYAVMAVTANEQNSSNCLNSITGSMGDYNIESNISYITTPGTVNSNCTHRLDENVKEDKTPLQVIIDVFVKYPDYDNPNGKEMTYHTRKLIKI